MAAHEPENEIKISHRGQQCGLCDLVPGHLSKVTSTLSSCSNHHSLSLYFALFHYIVLITPEVIFYLLLIYFGFISLDYKCYVSKDLVIFIAVSPVPGTL